MPIQYGMRWFDLPHEYSYAFKFHIKWYIPIVTLNNVLISYEISYVFPMRSSKGKYVYISHNIIDTL